MIIELNKDEVVVQISDSDSDKEVDKTKDFLESRNGTRWYKNPRLINYSALQHHYCNEKPWLDKSESKYCICLWRVSFIYFWGYNTNFDNRNQQRNIISKRPTIQKRKKMLTLQKWKFLLVFCWLLSVTVEEENQSENCEKLKMQHFKDQFLPQLCQDQGLKTLVRFDNFQNRAQKRDESKLAPI